MNLARLRHWRQPRAPSIDLRGERPRRWLWVLLGAVALGVWLLLWSDYWQALQIQEAEAEQVERQFTALAIQQEQQMQAALRTSPQQKKQLEAFARQSATPFALLDALGRTARELSLELESQRLEGSLHFIEQLKADTGLTVSLQQSARNTRDPMLPMSVKFKLGAQP